MTEEGIENASSELHPSNKSRLMSSICSILGIVFNDEQSRKTWCPMDVIID